MPNRAVFNHSFRAATGREMSVTVCRLQGQLPGPTLTLVAGQHGMEHMGPVVLMRFLDCCPAEFRGTVCVCPCANPFALELDYEFYPEREDLGKLKDYFYSRFRHEYCPFGIGRQTPYNMNRLWNRRQEPGLGVAGQIVSWLWDVACEPADLIIDFHCRNADKPVIFAPSANVLPIARYFGAQGIFVHPGGEDPNSPAASLLGALGNLGKRAAFSVEFSAQHGYKREEIPFGVNAILNVMKGIRMLDGPLVLDHPVYHVRDSVPVVAEATGHIYYHREPFDPVSKDAVLFDVLGLETPDVLHRGTAPVDGIMSEPTYRPIAVPGERICQVYRAEMVAPAGQDLDRIDVREFVGNRCSSADAQR